MNFGERLKDLRMEFSVTQEALATIIKVRRHAISKYETKNQQPDFDRLCQITDYFNVSTDYLLGRTTTRSLSEAKLPEPKLQPGEQHILFLYNTLNETNRERLVERAETMIELQEDDSTTKKGVC